MTRRGRQKLLAALLGIGSVTGQVAFAQTSDEEASDYENDYFAYQPAETVETSLKKRARSDKLQYCHDPEYVLYTSERPLCPLAEASTETCPEFKTACARSEELDRGDFLPGSLEKGRDKKRGGKRTNEQEPEPEPTRLELPSIVGVLFKFLFWAVIVVLVAVVVYLIASAIGRASKDRQDERDAQPDEPLPEKREKPGVVESDVARLLARAKQHRDHGRYAEAVDDLYAALLRYLEGEQLLVLERHRTNGDYVRSLRQHPGWQVLVRECGRDVERSQFGKRTADSITFDGLLRRIEPVVVRALTVLLLALGALHQTSCGGNEGEAPKEKRYWGALGDDSATGLSLFVGLLQDRGFEVRQRIRSVNDLDEEVGMLIVYDDTSLEDEDWKALEEWVKSGRELWIGGDAEAAAHFGGKSTGTACPGQPTFAAGYPATRVLTLADGSTRDVRVTSVAATLEASSDLSPLLQCDAPLWSRRTMGSGAVTLFGDASAFTNASMVSADNAVALLSLANATPLVVEFAGGLTGTGAESPYEALFNAKLGPLLLQMAIFMLVWYLSRGIPFATLRDPREPGRRQFLDHLIALGRVFQKANARQHALHHYAAWALAKLNDRVRPGQRMSVIELGMALAKRTGKPQAQVLEVLADAAAAKTPDAPPTGDELKVLKQLEAFVIETGGTK